MQLDMKNAFLQSKLDRVLYMYQPDYFDDGTGRVCKLLKSLYGLKQSPLLWYRALDGVLLGAGWKKSQVDEALYFKASNDGVTCWVLVYVDDLLVATSSPAMLKALKELLEVAFKPREISPVVKYLGLTIVRDRPARKLWLHQQGYANKLQSLELIGYVDADNAGDKQNRTSTGGYVFVYGGVAVSWLSSRIKCVTLSSTELEYVAATDGGKEGRRLRFLLADFKLLDAGKPTILRVDNKSAIIVAEDLGLSGNLKHMERRYAWLQHMVRCGKFVLKYILTTEQPADFLTKALHFPAFNRCSVAIGQIRLDDVGDGWCSDGVLYVGCTLRTSFLHGSVSPQRGGAKAVRELAPGKSPGFDRLPKELFDHNWDLLGPAMMDLVGRFTRGEELPQRVSTMVTILLHKKGDKDEFGNYHPITLLSTVYKIVAKFMASRLKKVLHEVISKDQYGFIPGRQLVDSVWVVAYAIEASAGGKEDLYLLMVDFQKAFDSISQDVKHICYSLSRL
ncbi:unnamed protein product [Closterium sp. NIES-53]